MAMDKNKGSSKRNLSPSPFESPAENRARMQREALAKKFKALQSPTPKKSAGKPVPTGKKKPVEVSNKTRMTVTSNLPSVGIANRRDMGPELTAPQMYSRESYTPGMSGGGRTSVKNINSTPIDPKYIWKNARDAAAKKTASKKKK